MVQYRDTSPARSFRQCQGSHGTKVSFHQIKSAALVLGLVASPQALLAYVHSTRSSSSSF